MTPIDDLAAQRRIERQKYRYCYLVDDGEYDRWVDLFVPDGTFHRSDGSTFTGHEELRRFATEIYDPAFQHTAHSVTNPLVEVDGDTASGRWYLYNVRVDSDGEAGWFQGRYDDQLRRVDGEWKFETVRVTAGASEG